MTSRSCPASSEQKQRIQWVAYDPSRTPLLGSKRSMACINPPQAACSKHWPDVGSHRLRSFCRKEATAASWLAFVPFTAGCLLKHERRHPGAMLINEDRPHSADLHDKWRCGCEQARVMHCQRKHFSAR